VSSIETPSESQFELTRYDERFSGIGLNYKKHAEECNLPIPEIPVVFLKPSTSLASPYPDAVTVPKFTLDEKPMPTADYESELGVVIGKDCKNVSEEEAMNYVLGYTGKPFSTTHMILNVEDNRSLGKIDY
jgi:2-keto-4-pentenoate hydratase/2-oxohepta-3-ene-1,7-dioic acid hydratase in catechol pathway